jgi:hypothetical protein
MGRLVAPVAEGWLVRLDDGEEVVVQVGSAGSLYQLIEGERVCVSLRPGQAPELTGYLA